MRIAVDGRRLRERHTSMVPFVTTIVRALADSPEVSHLSVLVPPSVRRGDHAERFAGVPLAWQTDSRPDARTFRSELLWTHSRLGRMLAVAGDEPDWLLTPYHQPATRLPNRTRCATFVHDICGLEFPKTKKNFYRHWIRLWATATIADLAIPVSHHTREELVRRFPSAAKRVGRVVHNAALSPPVAEDRILTTLTEFGLERNRFVIAFGSVDPRKNYDAVLAGFADFRRRGGEAGLVCVSSRSQRGSLADRALSAGLPHVRFISEISDYHRDALYGGALALLFPSTCEGFGYPIVEAMRQGCPPLAWMFGPAPELLGDAIPPLAHLDGEEIGARLLEIERLGVDRRAALARDLVLRSERFGLRQYREDLVAALRLARRH